jgi:hypothetical protein
VTPWHKPPASAGVGAQDGAAQDGVWVVGVCVAACAMRAHARTRHGETHGVVGRGGRGLTLASTVA